MSTSVAAAIPRAVGGAFPSPSSENSKHSRFSSLRFPSELRAFTIRNQRLHSKLRSRTLTLVITIQLEEDETLEFGYFCFFFSGNFCLWVLVIDSFNLLLWWNFALFIDLVENFLYLFLWRFLNLMMSLGCSVFSKNRVRENFKFPQDLSYFFFTNTSNEFLNSGNKRNSLILDSNSIVRSSFEIDLLNKEPRWTGIFVLITYEARLKLKLDMIR